MGDRRGGVSERRVGLFAEHEAALIPALITLSVADTTLAMIDWRHHADALEDTYNERDTARELSFSRTFEGRRELKGSFGAEPGQVIDAGLRLAMTTDADTDERSPKERRADALVEVFQFFLDNQTAKRGGRHRPHLNVVADVDDIKAGTGGSFVDGTYASAPLIEAILCDCNLHRVLKAGRSAILDYGRSVRTAPPDLFNAISLRDGHCREPGCDRPPQWCDAHHVDVWEEGGVTSVDNSVLRCVRHHHLWHRRRKLGWTEYLEPDGTLHISDPNGRAYVSYPAGPMAQRQLLVS